MKEEVYGNVIRLTYQGGDEEIVPYTLPDGYTIKRCNITGNHAFLTIPASNPLAPAEFSGNCPVVNGKSPCHFNVRFTKQDTSSNLIIDIIEFGCEPDYEYWNRPFVPQVRTRPDGTEYNIIPAGQYGVGG